MRLTAKRTLAVEPSLPAALEPLRRLARNLYWTWNTDAASLFERLDPGLWSATEHNPVRVLQLVAAERLAELSEDSGFLGHLAEVTEALDKYLGRKPQVNLGARGSGEVVAYFSLEFAFTESIPMYSGGLGVLAGDHIKSASDLGLPLVGVTLLYRQGYFHQKLAADGWQLEEYNDLDPATLPMTGRVRSETGEPLVVRVAFDSREVALAVWRCDVGGVPVFFLDSDLEENRPEDRAVCSRLYGGDVEMRIEQELLLGVGGYRALRAMGYQPIVCHMNEGHSALMAVERTRALMEEQGVDFDAARMAVAASTVFTTHTAVAAGIDLFPPELVTKYLHSIYTTMGLDDHTFVGLGRMDPNDSHEPFSMALLGLRMSSFRNGVSKLHGRIARELWDRAWPSLPQEQVPIGSITNGVHLPTWVSHEMGQLYDRYVGPGWRDDPMENANWESVRSLSDALLWTTHDRQRRILVQRARIAHRVSADRRGMPNDPRLGEPLDPNVLTIGFARRFAAYKRATLLLRDPERLAKLLNDPQRPMQFIFAGKAHPRDEPAKQLIREVVSASKHPLLRDRLVVLERYDVSLARSLVQGCDAWLNTPLRPLEASGTSGMKAVANGALHISVRDGWWAEAFKPGAGWAIGSDSITDEPDVQDAADIESLFAILENEVAPAFYDRDADGVPRKWVARMKETIASYAPVFSTHRMVGDYARSTYEPAAALWHQLTANGFADARTATEFLRRVRTAWPSVRVTGLSDDAPDEVTSGATVRVTATVEIDGLSADDLRVDLLYGDATAGGALTTRGAVRMSLVSAGPGSAVFSGTFGPGAGGRTGYTVRLTPGHPALPDVLDHDLVLWA